MTIAEEIRQLKDLVDSGVISTDEFESGKRRLLGRTANAPVAHLTQEHLVGKWRVIPSYMRENESYEITLMPNGRVKINSEIPNLATTKLETILFSAINVTSGEGKWWLDGSNLTMSVQHGNFLAKSLLKEKSLQTFVMKIISVDSNAMQAENEGGSTVQFFRIGI